ncbi:MAG: YggT family protein [Candidatus Aminicenantales bacterium]
MIFFANFLSAVARILHILLVIYIWVVIIRAVLSWVRVPALYSLAVVLYYLTEPVLRPVRRFVPPHRLGGVDISPIIIVLLILFVDAFLVKSLAIYAQQLLREHAPYY